MLSVNKAFLFEYVNIYSVAEPEPMEPKLLCDLEPKLSLQLIVSKTNNCY